jgi:hypothetical protein
MRSTYLLLILLILVFSIGCSNLGNAPVVPDKTADSPTLADNSGSNDFQVLTSGTMNLENGTIEPDNRTVDPYYNVTSIVGSNFSFKINGVIPPDILDITLTINNVSSLTVHDVCIVFDDLYGKTVTNPDSYIDVFDPGDINPFIAFRKEDPNRAFPPGIDTEKLYLKYPSGSPAQVRFIIIAHLGGNTGGVYELRDWNVSGQLTTSGGSAGLSVKALDHQQNVTSVSANTTALTGGWTNFVRSGSTDTWTATISNTQGAPVGDYTLLVKANSPSSPTYYTYNYFKVNVVTGQTAKIHSVNFVQMPSGDTWFDVCVVPDGSVYVAADHPATGNSGTTRTAIRYTNALADMTVMNPGTGMNNATPFYRIQVSNYGTIVNNPDGNLQAAWQDTGSTNLTLYDERILNYCINQPVIDFWNVSYAGDSYVVGVLVFEDCLQADKARVWPDSNPLGSWGGGMFIPPDNYLNGTVVGIDGFEETNEAVFFVSTPTDGYISRSGDWVTSHGAVMELNRFGSLGTGDGQFTGGLDIATDSTGQIITLESLGSNVYRFQKFTPEFTWVYSSVWQDNGNPMRMDFDRADNQLYLISSTGVHIMAVE